MSCKFKADRISTFRFFVTLLGQEQQFTLILQTLQQLRDVYGDSVDKIVQGNTSNIVFLKSTDDSMLDTLQKMSGVTHKSFRDSKTITVNNGRIFLRNEETESITVSTREVPVISYNDMAFIPERNSIVFRAGDSPIWNRNETILPMSWRLFQNTIQHPGHEYSLQTIPTLSSAIDFDIRKNQPDFSKMLNKRMNQAYVAKKAEQKYQEAYGYSDFDIEQLDPDNYADEIMNVINNFLRKKVQNDMEYEDPDEEFDFDIPYEDFVHDVEANDEQIRATEEQQRKMENSQKKIYAGHMLSREDLVSMTAGVQHVFDKDILDVYTDIKGDMWNDTKYFTAKNGNLYSLTGTPYIVANDESDVLKQMNSAAKDGKTRVYSVSYDGVQSNDISQDELNNLGSYTVTDAFYKFLVSLERWDFANGRFESGMAKRMAL